MYTHVYLALPQVWQRLKHNFTVATTMQAVRKQVIYYHRYGGFIMVIHLLFSHTKATFVISRFNACLFISSQDWLFTVEVLYQMWFLNCVTILHLILLQTLRKGASQQEKLEFLKEAQLMSNFKHDNILQLLGVCLDNDPNFIIMELMEGGDLLVYLRSHRPLIVSVTNAHVYLLI